MCALIGSRFGAAPFLSPANLLHIRDAIDRIRSYTHQGKEAFFTSSLLQDAVTRNSLTVLGINEAGQRDRGGGGGSTGGRCGVAAAAGLWRPTGLDRVASCGQVTEIGGSRSRHRPRTGLARPRLVVRTVADTKFL